MASKKRRLHNCKNHSRIVARGKCCQCGAWICRECAHLKGGQFFCIDTCAKEHVSPTRSQEPNANPGGNHRRTMPGLYALAALTLALCSVAFGLWQFRTASLLRQENHQLQRQRLDLLEALREERRPSDTASAQLKKEPKGTSDVPEPVVRSARPAKPVTYPPPPRASISKLGLPVSFDNGSPDRKLVALTFDGGSHANAAYEILDTLRSRRVRATMFLTGHFIRRHSKLVRHIVQEGHEVGNHTYSHPHLTAWAQERSHRTLAKVTPELIATELARADRLFHATTGRHFVPLWRAPYGEKNREICIWGQKAGYIHVGWRQGRSWRQSLDSNDWVPDEETPGYHSPREIYEKIISLASSEPYGANGGIVLFHLGTLRKDRKEQAHLILGLLIDSLRDMGYELVTVSRMMKLSGVSRSNLAQLRN